MADAREKQPSHPPSEPQPAVLKSAADVAAASDRPVRLQLIAALLLGLVLVATGLYLWRRPRTSPEAANESSGAAQGDGGAASLGAGDGGIALAAMADAGGGTAGGLNLSEVRVVSCHDRGSKKTPPDQCDHIASVEQAFARAVEQSATCVPAAAGGGTIEYMADVSFLKKKINVVLPKGNRSFSNAKVAKSCASAVKSALQSLSIDGVQHGHARYKLSLVATYPGPVKTGK